MSGELVDTQVLVYACERITEADAKKYLRKGLTDEWIEQARTQISASERLLNRLQVIRVSSLTYMEFYRYLKPEQAPRWAKYESRLKTIAFDFPIAKRALELLKSRKLSLKLCPRCLSPPEHGDCRECGRIVSYQQKMNDACIVATAEVSKDIDVLYTFDGGMLSFQSQVSRCRIEKPEHPYGELWEHSDSKKSSARKSASGDAGPAPDPG